MTRESFVALVGNATLLLSLVYVYDLLNVLRRLSGTWIRQVIAGLAIGAIGFFVMLMPWTFVTGVTFDTRSVLLAVSGLFFGAIPTAIAALVMAAVRLIQGGGGAWTGVSVIAASAAIGVVWRRAQRRPLAALSFGSLFMLGLVVHVVMLVLMFTLPVQTAIQIHKSIAIPVLVIYPISTAAYGTLMVDRLRRDEAAAAVRESESRFRALFEQAAFGVAKADVRTGRFALVNQHFADLLGYTPDELQGLNWQAITFADDRAAQHERTQELVSGRIRSFVVVKRYVRRDGSIMWASVTVSRLWAEGDKPDFTMAEIEDITERRAMERKLEQLASFPGQNPNPVVEVAVDGTVRYANPAALEALERLGLQKDARQFLPESADELGQLRVLCEQHPQARELALGKATFYRTVMAPPEPGTLRVYAIDITDTKTAQSRQERYLSMLDRSLNEIYVFDEMSLRFVYVNGSALHNLGYSLGELQQMTPIDIKPEFTSPDFDELLLPLRDGTRQLLVFETVHRRKDGSTYPVEVHLQRVQGEGQSWFLAFINDVSERQHMQAQLLQSQKMEAVGELAGGVAHDFNNMLTGILGNVAIIHDTMSPRDPLRENVHAIETAAQEAANLTRGLLTFSRGAVVQPVALDTNASVERIMAVLKQSLPESLTIVSNLESDTWNVYMDQAQMTQILLNLGVNARDAMNGRGTITVATRNAVVDASYVETHHFARQGDFVVVSVADTGSGIPPEALPHIFEPFFTTKPVGSGTGLGLSVVYGAANQAGGWITVQSEAGRGTLFEVYLPRSTEQQPAEAPATAADMLPCIGTVLVVEDEPVVSAVTRSLLTRAGCDVLTAVDGASALHALQEHADSITLVLLDMTMPGLTTEEIVSELRRLYPTLPVLLTSGFAPSDTVTQLVDTGSVQGFLPKPYDFHELLQRVGQLTHAKGDS
ncbi:MAG TPA: PAS domain S-box protein [Clostridia bacterium]|nr:PAS domain S-box protein [Clostridia bacterium]